MFSLTKQLDARDCGPACLHMVSRHYGRQHNLALLREQCHITREGVSMLGISDAAEKIGFRTIQVSNRRELCINGVPVKLHGVNHHDTHPKNGWCQTEAELRAAMDGLRAARHEAEELRAQIERLQA